jgi:hypothetical protein
MKYFEISDFPKAFKISESDLTRPWGGYWCISHEEINQFINTYFKERTLQVVGEYSIHQEFYTKTFLMMRFL